MAFDETGQQALAEQLHHRVSVPRLERVKRAIVREGALGHEDVPMRMPLQEVAARGDAWKSPRGTTPALYQSDASFWTSILPALTARPVNPTAAHPR